MHKTTKGALAAAAAVALLTGGAGTLAFWSDADTISTPDLASGGLDITLVACPDWTLDDAAVLGAREIVPGDTLTRTCTYTITAEGDHLEAELNINKTLVTPDVNGLVDELDLAAVFTINGGAFTNTVVTPATPVAFVDGTYTLSAAMTADFPFGVEDNESQNDVVTLDDIAVTLTQTDNHP